ncbi:hypothetical protein [Streptomyces parvulus]|uniref:hypothetical protein n=1 Tax=Streptomyces parvulus TaxID=146923 RepID=UPI0037F90A5E
MPSPNGYLTGFSYSVQDRQSFRVTLNHDINSPPWLPGQAGSYTLVWETGPTAAGPWTAAPLTDLASGCTPQPDNETTVGGVTSTLVRIGDPTPGTGMTADTDYHVRVTVLDSTDVQVDQWVLDSPAHTFAYPTLACAVPSDVTQTSATGNLSMPTGRLNFTAPCNQDTIIWELATSPGGPYTEAPSEPVTDFTPSHTFTGLTAGTTYYYRARVSEQAETAAEYLVTPECSFTTEEAPVTTPPFSPQPCAGGGAGADAVDVEQFVLCDLDAEGNLLGTALAVYEYDTSGAPTGAPTFVNPATGDAYVPQGTLQPCPDAACLPPMQFCQTSTTTGPVDHPGRQYDITLPVNQGFGVDSLQIDAITHAAGITWSIFDVDGAQFAADLETFIQGRMPSGSTVTVTNPNAGVTELCGPAQPFQIHIECLRLDQAPPNLVELVYNGGEDLVQNPAYNEVPPFNIHQPCGFHLPRRQDAGGTLACTSVANRGWETNDSAGTFEIWCDDVRTDQDTTPTPRGTPVQEISSFGSGNPNRATIWQTFQVPAAGNFTIRVVHGARDPGEEHRITLSTGDTDDNPVGDVITDISSPPSVTESGGPNPWTTFSQSQALAPGTYTLALSTTNPVFPQRGGLFTDMRVFVDRPGLRATAVTDDDTCVVTVDETTTTTTCSYWQPQCAGGAVVGWQKTDTGETLSNAAFWAQVPTPGCCLPEESSDGGSSGAQSNMLASDLVCVTIGGIAQNAIRMVVTDPSGGVLQEQFLGLNGAPIAPESWTPGACTTDQFMADQVLCDFGATDPDTGGPVQFLRKYVQTVDVNGSPRVDSRRDFALDGSAVYLPVGPVGVCAPSCDPVTTTGLCLADGTPIGVVNRRDCDTGTLAQDGWINLLTGAFTAGAPPVGTMACGASQSVQVSGTFCDIDGTGDVQGLVLIEYVYGADGSIESVRLVDATTGATYVPVGTITTCPAGVEQPEQDIAVLCDVNGGVATPFIRDYRRDELGAIVGSSDYTLAGAAYVPTGTVGVCQPDSAVDRVDAESQVLCDADGTRFLRTYAYDAAGVVTGFTDRTLTGAAFAPVGAVGACSDCCPITVAEVCLTNGNPGVILRNPDGTLSRIDTVTGATFAPGDIVNCAPTINAQGRLLTAGQAWTPGADLVGTLTSITATVLTGTASYVDQSGTAVAGLPAGHSWTWQNSQEGTLQGPQSITAVGGTVHVVWTQR